MAPSRVRVCTRGRAGVRVRSVLDFSGWVLITQAARGPLCSTDGGWGVGVGGVGSFFFRRSMSL